MQSPDAVLDSNPPSDHDADPTNLASDNSTSVDVNPPPYSGPPPQFQSYFGIPSYEEAVVNDDMDDSIRLPSYSGRSLSRFHPYWPYTRPRPNLTSLYDVNRYLNTIFDEEYVPLFIPPLAPVHPQEAADRLASIIAAIVAPPGLARTRDRAATSPEGLQA